MSETIRSYSQPSRASYGTSVSGGRGLGRRIVAIALVAGLVWLLWTTRDTWPMERLVPRDQTFHLRADQLLATRERAANSPVWDLGLLPESYRDTRAWLQSDFELPPWVLNNLSTGICYVSGRDLENFSDLLVVTRMSRIGCLLERYYGIADNVEEELAGGLRLQRIGDSGAYYAVRGRTLLFSRSREALIRALTLREDEAVQTLEDTVAPMAGDIQGRIDFAGGGAEGGFLTQSDFGLRFAPESITFTARGTVAPAWQTELDRLLPRRAGSRVDVPVAGSLVIAGDFATPVPALWKSADELSGGALARFWAGTPWALAPESPESGWTALMAGLNAQSGSAFSLRWTGFDANGVVPLPEIELYLETRGGDLKPMLDAIPALPAGQPPVDFAPYRDIERGIVRCPIGWGGVVEPALAAESGGVRVALLPIHLEHILALDRSREPGPEGAQLVARMRPLELLELLHEGGKPYVRAGLLPGHTPESFESAMSAAIAGARQVSEVRASAGYAAGELTIEAEIRLVPEGAQAEVNTASE